jgi:hypothetical protein
MKHIPEGELLALIEQSRFGKWVMEFRLAKLVDEWDPTSRNAAATAAVVEYEDEVQEQAGGSGTHPQDPVGAVFNAYSPLTEYDEGSGTDVESIENAITTDTDRDSEGDASYTYRESATNMIHNSLSDAVQILL